MSNANPHRSSFSLQIVQRLARGRPMGFGAYLFVAHRCTGVLLTIYLYVHLVTLGTVLQGPDGFNRAMIFMSTPSFELLEVMLIWGVLFHTLNGVRLLILAAIPIGDTRWLDYAVVSLSLVIVIVSLPLLLG